VAVIGELCVAVIVGVCVVIAGAATSATVMLTTDVAVRAGVEESVAVMVKTVLAKVTAGVPEILPVALNVSPVGSDAPPAPTIVYVTVPVNPVSTNAEVSVMGLSFVALKF
jgi:hypothetical protein